MFVRLFAAILLSVSLVGCKTIPVSESIPATWAAPSPTKGTLRITEFRIPKDEPGAKLLHFMVLLGGGRVDFPMGAFIYDVTSGLDYLGHWEFKRAYQGRGRVEWLRELEPGKHTLMLVEAPPNSTIATVGGGSLKQVDFVEIELNPGEAKHVVLSRQGALNKPYFGKIEISSERRKSCEGFAAKGEETTEQWKNRMGRINEYMKLAEINMNANDFRLFCHVISSPGQIIVPNAEALKQFSEMKAVLEEEKKERYRVWRSEARPDAQYDLMKIYVPALKDSIN